MKISETINGLITLPRKFHNLGNMSIYDLLKETGYFEIHYQISVESIRDALALSPEYIEDWIVYSEDNRSDGWYFKQQSDQRYVVGFIDGEGNYTHTEYNDRLEACAIYIKQEVNHIMNIMVRSRNHGK